jgi:ketosteroid isomerase-like protein
MSLRPATVQNKWRKSLVKYIFGVLLVTVAAFGVAFGQCSDADKKALEAFDHAWGAASVGGDRATLTGIYADDYMGLPGMQDKAAAIDAAVKASEKNKANPNPDKVSYDNYIISCTPNTATITHRNTIWTPEGTGGKPETFYTRSVHFLEKRGGKWLVVSNVGGGLDDFGVLWYLEHDWNNAAIKRDKDWFTNNFASDYSSVSSGTGALRHKDDDIADMIKGAVEDWNELSDMNIRIEGNTAVVTGINHVKGKDDKGVAYDRKIRFTDTWIKRDGRWQAWATQGTRIP